MQGITDDFLSLEGGAFRERRSDYRILSHPSPTFMGTHHRSAPGPCFEMHLACQQSYGDREGLSNPWAQTSN